MALSYQPVTSEKDIEVLAQQADEIWHEYWPDLIGAGQTDYMVEQFQSIEAITRDIGENGYLYFLIYDEEGTPVGYTGGRHEDYSDDPLGVAACAHGQEMAKRWARRLFISKIYLYAEQRGKHYASRIIEFWEEKARENNLDALYLTVNKGNELGVRAYLGRGFETIEALEADIGNGYVMDDYIMAKAVK